MLSWIQNEERAGRHWLSGLLRCMPTAKNTGAQARPAEPESGIEISPRKLLEAALYKAWVTIQQEDKLTKATMDGVVQLLKLHREYSPQENVPTKYRVEWLTESELASLED